MKQETVWRERSFVAQHMHVAHECEYLRIQPCCACCHPMFHPRARCREDIDAGLEGNWGPRGTRLRSHQRDEIVVHEQNQVAHEERNTLILQPMSAFSADTALITTSNFLTVVTLKNQAYSGIKHISIHRHQNRQFSWMEGTNKHNMAQQGMPSNFLRNLILLARDKQASHTSCLLVPCQ